MAGSRYVVSPARTGGWTLSREEQVLAHYPTRAGAIFAGLELAKTDAPSELHVLGPEGELEEHLELADPEEAPDEPASYEGLERLALAEGNEHRARLRLKGDLAHQAWLVQVIREIMDELEDPNVEEFVIDMGQVTGFDVQSAVLWVGLEHFVREKGRLLVIVNASSAVLEVLKRLER